MIQKQLTQDDTAPVVFSRFRTAAGELIPTNQVSGVRFSMTLRGQASAAVNRAVCSITSSGADPLVCQWEPGDTDLDTPGTYDAELEITYLSTKVKHYPEQQGQFVILVRKKLA